ncbi:hypothetical protein FAUST_7376 [Fusarium austroamericanum]|uniref:F-box domain-containing protein n=1 Tax=Fusarium austroamericanum TaxID=282268 RepID=A0AAN5Z6L8_FUSAU|nr:hypothetical protein FAUST_7376 [Fusarium austroamericanum]
MSLKLVELLSDQHSPNLDIVDLILSNLGIAGIFALHATCRRLRWVVRHMTESPYLLNINKKLERYFDDPASFRYQLGKCNGVIRGDFVRSFMAFSSPTSSTLDVVAQGGSNIGALMRYLHRDEGYIRDWQRDTPLDDEDNENDNNDNNDDDSSDEDDEDNDDYTLSYGFIILRRRKPFDVSVRIKLSSPIFEIINNADTSADLMFVSWNKVYCLFPLPTIKRHKFFFVRPADGIRGDTPREYKAAGWTTRDFVWPDEAPELIPREALQQIGGQRSLIIDLTDPPIGEFTPDYVLESGVFSINWAVANFDGHYILSVGVHQSFTRVALRYINTTGLTGISQQSWHEFLQSRVRLWVYMELRKMDPIDMPACNHLNVWYKCPMCVRVRMPSTWDYADDHVSTWFQEWRRKETGLVLLPPAPVVNPGFSL